MKEIKDRDGNVVGAIRDDDVVVDKNGNDRGWVKDDAAYSFGARVGDYMKGWFLDPNGRVIATTTGDDIGRREWSSYTFDHLFPDKHQAPLGEG